MLKVYPVLPESRRDEIADLAAHACCSVRTLTRRFHAETGSTPKRWLLSARLARARELLETTDLPVELVAGHAGFPTAAALRARFSATLHTTPTAYRVAFRGRSPARKDTLMLAGALAP